MSVVLHNVWFRFGSRPVLDGVTGEAPAGAITAVIGPNAAGKSTLLRLVSGALRPTSGTVRLGTGDPARMQGAELAASLAYVPQQPRASARFTAWEVVELGRFRLAADPAAIESALAVMDLLPDAERPVPDLSVGQQQRVAIARALAQLEPGGTLILDEPTASIDLRHRAALETELRARASGGATILIALHDLPAAARLADSIWLIDGDGGMTSGSGAAVLQPERLEQVFGVGFEWVTASGGPVLLPVSPA